MLAYVCTGVLDYAQNNHDTDSNNKGPISPYHQEMTNSSLAANALVSAGKAIMAQSPLRERFRTRVTDSFRYICHNAQLFVKFT